MAGGYGLFGGPPQMFYFEILRKTAISWGQLVTQPWLKWFLLNTNTECDCFHKLRTVSNFLQLYEVYDWSSVVRLPKNKFMMNFLKAGFIFCAKLQLCLCHSFLIEMCEIWLSTSWLLLQAVVSCVLFLVICVVYGVFTV